MPSTIRQISGEWVLLNGSSSASDQAFALIVRQTITRTNIYGSPMKPFYSDVSIERHFKSGVVAEHYSRGGYGTVPGIPPGASSSQGDWTLVSVKWERDRLVITNGKYSGPAKESGPYSEHEEEWSLDGKERLLITFTDRSSSSESTTIRLVYRRR